MTRSAAKPKSESAKKAPPKITESILARAHARRPTREKTVDAKTFFAAAKPFPGVVPKGQEMAMDENLNAAAAWAGSLINSSFLEGQMFLGYAYLSELAQRPEYRVISETIATEMTREWIELSAVGDEDKTDKIEELNKELERLNVRGAFQKIAQQDGFFGRAHLYLDTGDSDEPNELKTAIGDGWSKASKNKVGKGDLKAVKPIEAVWCYPANYNSNDPLQPDWYRPSSWFVQGKELHASRLLTFIGREVPDLLKPAYSFGGLSMSQMAKPYVDNWLRTRQSVADLIHAFSVFVLETDLSAALQADGDQLFKRLALFDLLRDNRGVMAVNTAGGEKMSNVSAPLGTLDVLQAQTQEHMAAVSRIPIVKLLGVQPAGLNADSEGVMRCFDDLIHAAQEHLFRINLHRVIGFTMISLWGEVDDSIVFKFKPLRSLDRKGMAEVAKMEADTDCALIDRGVLDPIESRRRIAGDPDSRYGALNVDDVPDGPDDEDALDPGPGAGEEGAAGAEPGAAPAEQRKDPEAPAAQPAGKQPGKEPAGPTKAPVTAGGKRGAKA